MFIVLAAVAALVLASAVALYSYGRFAERAQGEASYSLPVSDDATPLDRLVAPLVEERPNESGLTLVADNLDAFAARVLAARQAGRSLDLQYYIWQNDLTGRLLAWEIVKAADRGVRVRLLLDDINAQGYDKAYLTLDAHPNIAIRLYTPAIDDRFSRAASACSSSNPMMTAATFRCSDRAARACTRKPSRSTIVWDSSAP